MISASDAIERLKAGNLRYTGNQKIQTKYGHESRRNTLLAGQEPIAIILGCSDSRVPAEIIFDQGLGDLFVIRVAGNIVAPSQIGSVEFAVENYAICLVVVLGHSSCGVVIKAVDRLKQTSKNLSPNINSIVERVRPSVETLVDAGLGNDRERLIEQAVRANVRTSVDHLLHGSDIIERAVSRGELIVGGAEYNLETGNVNFFYRL